MHIHKEGYISLIVHNRSANLSGSNVQHIILEKGWLKEWKLKLPLAPTATCFYSGSKYKRRITRHSQCWEDSNSVSATLKVSDVLHLSSGCWAVVILCIKLESFLPQFSGKDPNQHKRVSVKSNPGFLERLSETAGGTVVGVGLFFLSIYILFTNEVRSTHSEENSWYSWRSH